MSRIGRAVEAAVVLATAGVGFEAEVEVEAAGGIGAGVGALPPLLASRLAGPDGAQRGPRDKR